MNIFKVFDKIFRPNNLWDKIDIKELEGLWLNPSGYKAPKFPIIHTDYFDYKLSQFSRYYLIKDNIKMVFGDPDYYGYQWDESEQFIDSDGHFYKGGFKAMNHPLGWAYPIEIDKRITLNELKELVIQGKRYQEIKDKIPPLDQFNSIKELIENLK